MSDPTEKPGQGHTIPRARGHSDRPNTDMTHKWRQVGILSLAELLAMTLWFSASAVVPQLTEEWKLTSAQQSWITMSVQLGFVAGALLSAVLNVPDRISSRLLFGYTAFTAAAVNAAIPLLASSFYPALILRLLTGFMLAGVYPPGMKLVATWCRNDRGLGIGILVGALTVGSAFPHLLAGLPFLGDKGLPSWRLLMLITSGQAVLAGLVILFAFRTGPFLAKTAPFDWRYAGKLLTRQPTRLANFGYLGHMWELFAMWTWVPMLLLESYRASGWPVQAARIAGFAVIGIGAAGCVLAGKLADRFGRTAITIASLVLSGACALVAGHLVHVPGTLTAICLIWGFAVVADSAQFSAAVSELTDPRYVGTALTVQTSLGFVLTLATIYVIPQIKSLVGWDYALMLLAFGPLAGIASMYRLRRLPDAMRMARGNR
jgi:MFS family permease